MFHRFNVKNMNNEYSFENIINIFNYKILEKLFTDDKIK